MTAFMLILFCLAPFWFLACHFTPLVMMEFGIHHGPRSFILNAGFATLALPLVILQMSWRYGPRDTFTVLAATLREARP